MSLCNWRFVAAACQHMTRAIRGADFEEMAMAESRCNAQVVTDRHLLEVLFIKPEEPFKSFERGQRFDTIKT